jgi:hypothetical protein
MNAVKKDSKINWAATAAYIVAALVIIAFFVEAVKEIL